MELQEINYFKPEKERALRYKKKAEDSEASHCTDKKTQFLPMKESKTGTLDKSQ